MSTNTGRIDLTDINSSILPFALETLFLGANIVLMPLSTYVLWHKGLKSRVNAIMFLATLLMFTVSIAHWVLTLVFFMDTMLASILSCSPKTGPVRDFVAREWLPLINILLTDAIVLWRTWVVLGHKSKLFLVVGYSIVLACIVITLALKFTDYAMFACTIAINLCSTIIMGYKTWSHRRMMKKNDLLAVNATAVQMALILLVESGALYCVLWILTMSLLLTGMENGFLIMASILVPVSGIYPTIIIVLVCLQKAHHDTLNLDRRDSSTSPRSTFPSSHTNEYEYELRLSTNASLPTTPRPVVDRTRLSTSTSTSQTRRHTIPLQFGLNADANRSSSSWPNIPLGSPVEEK
ncbi:uncharacterized protein STEHIDRAFT_153223 [Stereum hirsutum FP-91666 SS1]|uniref:uncharacterized protein n=1 Tax=Stereum hirsutum (strain FP-91666) TaxID=721885 RepID=UPI000440D8C3|nr:uncharacterized protein STEHIDRAFT_153223 [Stereum hirsutum FP-91666 SS1]EIM91593.1 hypothetical protein STEHIDRAFT_153223 [Stereum hirsutum FP-91666 SS1]